MRRMEGRIQAGNDGGMKRKCIREKKIPNKPNSEDYRGKNLANKAKEEIGGRTMVMYEI